MADKPDASAPEVVVHDEPAFHVKPAEVKPTAEVAPVAPPSAKPPAAAPPSAVTAGVSAIHVGALDAAENEIVAIYSKVSNQYAVYLALDRKTTTTRVVVQYADDTQLAAQQRKRMAPLNAKRSEITGLLSNWSDSRLETFQEKARSYQGELAAALILCLEDDPDGALASLNEIANDIIEDRTSWGRFEYLLAASAAAMVSILLLQWIKSVALSADTGTLWLAGRAGAVGAFFSVAIALRNRSVLPNSHRKDNIADAVLRIVIGVIAAGVLILILRAAIMPGFKIGDAVLSGSAISWPAVLVVGFLAGFLERLVPDLLTKAEGDRAGAGGTAGAGAAKGSAAGRGAPA